MSEKFRETNSHLPAWQIPNIHLPHTRRTGQPPTNESTTDTAASSIGSMQIMHCFDKTQRQTVIGPCSKQIGLEQDDIA